MKIHIFNGDGGFAVIPEGSPLDEECPTLLETIEAYSWGHAMTYFHATYLDTLYNPLDPCVWEPFDAKKG